MQIMTACFDSFAHGANDVANAVGPFAACWYVYSNNGKFSKKNDIGADMYWILAIGGLGIVVGLGLYGCESRLRPLSQCASAPLGAARGSARPAPPRAYVWACCVCLCLRFGPGARRADKIMFAIGLKLAKVTPSRGFAIELGSMFVVLLGSRFGIPLSTTHCQVGSTIGVSLTEGRLSSTNWSLVGRAALGWIFTMIVAGLLTACIFSMGYAGIQYDDSQQLGKGWQGN